MTWSGTYDEQPTSCLRCGNPILARFRTVCDPCLLQLDSWTEVKRAEQAAIIARDAELKRQLELDEREEKKRKRKSSRSA